MTSAVLQATRWFQSLHPWNQETSWPRSLLQRKWGWRGKLLMRPNARQRWGKEQWWDRPVWLRAWSSKLLCVKLKRCLSLLVWGKATQVLPVWQASSPSPPCALLLPCRGSGSASKEEGEPEAGDRASLAGEAAGAQRAASVKLQFTLKN